MDKEYKDLTDRELLTDIKGYLSDLAHVDDWTNEDIREKRIFEATKYIQEIEYRDSKICRHCNLGIEITNPSGYCNHVYFPENDCLDCKKINGR